MSLILIWQDLRQLLILEFIQDDYCCYSFLGSHT
jgi:hypothetical protein